MELVNIFKAIKLNYICDPYDFSGNVIELSWNVSITVF